MSSSSKTLGLLAVLSAGMVSTAALALDLTTDGGTAVTVSQTNHDLGAGPGYMHVGEAVQVTDIDGDGNNDVVTGAKGYKGVHIGFGDGTGLAFDTYRYGTGTDAVWGVGTGDMNGDGDVDVVALEKASDGSWNLLLYQVGSDRTTQTRTTLASSLTLNFGDEPGEHLAVMDLDADGDLDVAVAGGLRLHVYTNDGAGSLSLTQSVDGDPAVHNDMIRDLQVGDVTGDGIDDIVSAAWTRGAFMFEGDGVGGFAQGVQIVTGGIWSNGDLGDVDGDGDLDFTMKGRRAGELKLFLNDGTGGFDAGTSIVSGGAEYGLFLDADGDGDDDYFYGGHVYEATGGTLTRVGGVTLNGTERLSLFPDGAGDLDGDGDLEIIFGGNAVAGTQATSLPGGGSGYTPDGVCDADDEIVSNTNGIADDCDGDDDGVHVDEDCDDADATTGLAGTWYADIDGDGLGDLSSPESACTQPSGTVANSDDLNDDDFDNDGLSLADDCDDADAATAGPTTWYADNDGDGLGDVLLSQSACDQPAGYVGNSDDTMGDDDFDNDGVADADDVCEGIADVDTDADGVTDCLEETLTLTGDRSHVRWFSTRTGKARVSRTRVTYDKNKSWAAFSGQMELGGGLLAPDFRDASDNGNGQVEVSIGGTTVYDETLAYDVYDRRSSSTSDNREKWQHKASHVNSYGKRPYAYERAVLRFKNTMRYRSWQESGYPALSDQDNYGRVHSRFISADESRIRIRWNRLTALPLTVGLNGVDLVTISDNGDGTYSVDGGDYTTETVFRGNGRERKRVIDIVYPDNLQEGDAFTWTDGGGVEFHSQVLEESATSTSNTDSVWYNAGGRFHLRVPLGEAIINGDIDQATCSPTASVRIQIGNADSAGVVEGTTDYAYDVLESGHWRIAEVDEDAAASSEGQGGNQAGSTCEANDSDDPEPAE